MWTALSLATYLITNIGGVPCPFDTIKRKELKLKVEGTSDEIFVMQIASQTKEKEERLSLCTARVQAPQPYGICNTKITQ